MTWWFKLRSILDWKTARSCVSTPRWCRLTFIIRPTTRYCGMWCASSPVWSDASARRWNCDVSRVFATARVRHGSRMYEIQRMTTRQRDEEQTGTYRELIGIAEEVVERARMALEKTSKRRGKDML